MKKQTILSIGIVLVFINVMVGCGKEPDHSIFTKARINQGSSSLWEVDVASWEEYGTMIQIETKTGATILVDKTNIILTRGI